MKNSLKKTYNVIEIILAVLFIGAFIFNVIDKTVISRNSMRVFALIYVVIHAISILSKNNKGGYFTLVVFAVSVAVLLLSASSLSITKKDYYDLETQIGQLRHDIYEESKVNVYYNVDVADEEDVAISYTEDYHISEEEALKSLKKIREVLSKYKGGLPSSIYLVNGFSSKGREMNSAYIIKGNYVILKNQEDLEYSLHSQIGHSIENKTYDLISFLKFRNVKEACSLVSDMACDSNDELFAQTIAQFVCNNKETAYSQAIQSIIDKNIK